MKLFHRIITVAAGIMALSSCVEEALSPLTGKYEKPETYEMNTLVAQSVEKGEKTRTFTVEVADGNASLNVKFIGDKYFLADENYTASPEGKKGTYLVGNGGSTFTKGGNTVAIESGTIIVKNADGIYNMSGMLWLADESVVEITSSVALAYEPDPEPVIMSTVLMAQNNVVYGTNSVTVQLAQEGIYSEFDMNTYQNIWHGEGNYMAIDLYSADGYLHEGTYVANAVGGVIEEGQFGIGYDTTVDYGWGPMEVKDYGTCWWTVANGAATAEKILEGTVTVTQKGSKWVIELISGEGKEMVWGKFEGAIDALTPQETTIPSPEYVMTEKVEQVFDQTWAPVAGVEKHTVTLTSGETVAAVFELITTEGGVIEGTYECQEYASAAGLMGNGYSIPDWNMEGGSRYWVDGEMVLINAGETLEVTKYAEGLYGFAGSTGYEFIASTSDYAGGGETPSPGTEYDEFTELLVVQANQGYDETGQPTGEFTSLTLKFGTEGIYTEVVNNGWYDETKIKGNGQVLSIDFYTADGTLAAGTYKACAVGGTIGEGEFGIGYDVEMWGTQMVWGTCVTPYENDTEGAIEKVTDGTITVEVSGDEYKISLESSVINAQYVGSLTL